MSDPLVSLYSHSATLMLGRFLTELAEKDPAFCGVVYQAHAQGHRVSLALVIGGGTSVIELEMVDDYGHRRRVASITAEMPDVPAMPPH